MLTLLFTGTVLAFCFNMITVRSEIAGPDGLFRIKGFPFESGSYFFDLQQGQASFVLLSYTSTIGNALVAFFIVFGIWGNYIFFRELRKDKNVRVR